MNYSRTVAATGPMVRVVFFLEAALLTFVAA